MLQPWFLILAALFGFFAMALSANRVASFVGRWAWKAIRAGIVWGLLYRWLRDHLH